MIDPKEKEKRKDKRIEPDNSLTPSEILKFRKLLSAVSPLAISGSFPSRIICIWPGSIDDIPAGWIYCNGENGTRDMRGLFIKGAAAGQAAGAKSGSPNHTHGSHTALTHSGTAVGSHGTLTHSGSAVGDHSSLTHSGTAVTAHSVSYDTVPGTGPDTIHVGNGSHSVTQASAHTISGHSVTQPASHGTLTHGVTQPNDHSISGHNSVSNEPESIEVIFVQKA